MSLSLHCPLLANIYLDPLDWLKAVSGFEMVRYADDMVVICRSREEAEAALEKLREWMAGAGLTLHPDKTRTVDMTVADSHFDFLGYRFKRSRQGGLMRLVRPNRHYKQLGLFCLLDVRETKFASLRNGANH